MNNIKNYNLEDLKQEMISIGEKPYRAEQIFKWIYVDKVKSFEEMTNLSLELRKKLEENYTMCNFEIIKKQESSDGTKKYLFDVWMEMQLKLFSWNITVGKQYVFHRKLAVKWGANFVHQQEYHYKKFNSRRNCRTNSSSRTRY